MKSTMIPPKYIDEVFLQSRVEEGNGTGEGRQPIDVETCRVGIRDIQFSGMVNGYTGRREWTLLGRGREVCRGKEEEGRVRGGRGEEEKYGEGKRRKREIGGNGK